MTSIYRIDMDEGTSIHLDDLAISGDLIQMVRIERMSDGVVWGAIYLKDKREITLHFKADTPIEMVAYEDSNPHREDG